MESSINAVNEDTTATKRSTAGDGQSSVGLLRDLYPGIIRHGEGRLPDSRKIRLSVEEFEEPIEERKDDKKKAEKEDKKARKKDKVNVISIFSAF